MLLLLGLLLSTLSLFSAGVSAAEVDLKVEGVDGKLKENVTAYIGKLTLDDIKAWRVTRARLVGNLRDAMQSEGYYDTQMQIEHTSDSVSVTLQPGEPVHVQKLVLVLQGEMASDSAFATLREALPLRQGDIFHHGKYEALKSALQSLALERGYFDAEWAVHAVSVDPAKHVADIELVYDGGQRYHFGPVHFTNLKGGEQTLIKPDLLQRLLPFSEGDPYEANRVLKLNKLLLDARYFSEVRVSVQRDKTVDHAVPIEVMLGRDKANNIDFGAGYSTDVKQRLTIKAQRPLLNSNGHSLEANAELSPVRSSFDTKYTVPLSHPINDTLQYFYGVKREDVDQTINWNTVLGVQRQIKKDSGWQRTYSLRFNRDSTELPFQSIQKKDLVLPGIGFDRTRSKGGVDPYWGDRISYQMEVASKDALSDASLVSLRTGIRFLRTFAGRHQFLLRGDAGAIVTSEFNNVPQSMRFFAGGDQSIRGYGYKSISPKDINGISVGARNLLTGSAEYDYEFIPRWRAAVFTDGGSAFDSIHEHFYVGSGVGIRWVSPVGPIRLDFAWAVSEPGTPFRLHFSMGPNL
jgi:translocation and assembly module TamA